MCIDSSTYAYQALPFLFATLFAGVAYLLTSRMREKRLWIVAAAALIGLGLGFVITTFSGTLRC